ncbi:chaperone modulator CbpM [Robiginitalea marina]|uniref:Chaperone modulator CbpM n=1 Tax=Robiginitalea marina TaxID=2954105 RepID=A0ABT1AVB7_9FLAO|nr:chaperone modulator CbpM [Robiginitalea marina]MCO5723947.1 chaperone modulator CbpM [Robiginitalea marina]
MPTEKYIRIADFCRGHSLEENFVFSLQEFELIEVQQVSGQPVIHRRELHRLERLVRLYNDFGLSPQGLMAVDHLLGRVERLQEEVLELRRRLDRWE